MEIGIIGLPQSGKTTVFNALTHGKADTAIHSRANPEPNVGVAKVPDDRLKGLEAIFHPSKTVYAEVKYVDVAPPRDFGKLEGVSGHFLEHLSQVDALIHVVRAFPDETVPHVEGSIGPERDIASLDLELAFSDLTIIQRRLTRIDDTLKGADS